MDAPIWDVTVFTKNRERLLAGDVAAKFLARVLNQRRVKTLLSDDHFSVDGTLIEAWASIQSFMPRGGGDRGDGAAEDSAPKGRNAERDFHAEKRSNDSHASTTDPDARLFRKGRGKEARLCRSQAVLHGPFADGEPARPDRRCHADPRHRHRRARGRDDHAGPPRRPPPHDPQRRQEPALAKAGAYDVADLVDRLRAIRVTPHVAQNLTNRRSAIDGRTTRYPGYAISQRIRKRIEEAFGWIKTSGGLRKTWHRGQARAGWTFTLTAAACNLIRLPKLLAAA
jgi:Transposase DDE domain